MKHQNIRNFCIIAHIDHGKSTLADRFLELTNTLEKRAMQQQQLDSMDLEREKGITIKLKAVRMKYAFDNVDYQLNLIDTPGHVDFSYEVSRSLAACEGAILVVDASQGIEAQTVSNVYKALEADLKIVPVLNKIDLPGSDVAAVTKDLINTFGFKEEEILQVSAKTGENVENLLQEVIKRVEPPKGDVNASLRALVFDSYYDEYLGVIAIVKIVDGSFSSEQIQKKTKIKFIASGASSVPESIGILVPTRKQINQLSAGEVGYVSTGLKDITSVKVGDTLTVVSAQNVVPLPGYKEVMPFVFVSIYPLENDRFPDLRTALEKLSLSDSALTYDPENNSALGYGFRCGFLGLLHADVIQERLEREFNLELISTTPTVEYKVVTTKGEQISVKTPAQLPDPTFIREITEPWILLTIIAPTEYNGSIIQLCENRRGIMRKMHYTSESTVMFEYELPLAELVYNFFSDLKTVSSGYASLDYELLDFRSVKAVKLNILIHGEAIEPLSHIVLKSKAEEVGRKLLIKLKDVIPKQQYQVALQASVGGKIVAREDIPAMRKNVLQHIYGGHRERKDKLLDRQKKGKERLKRLGKVDIPQEAFRQILSV
ncbi:MAG: translation elongation factor 4 [Patescibacteria group bacterium]